MSPRVLDLATVFDATSLEDDCPPYHYHRRVAIDPISRCKAT